MVVDTSALVAIVRNEPEKPILLQRLSEARVIGEPMKISAATWVEVVMVVDRYRDASASTFLDALLVQLKLEIVPVDQDLASLARIANQRFGKGFHPARLNLGDCFSYALAAATGEPLLFKGDDFSRTDVRSAL